jgi:hypothetical protein
MSPVPAERLLEVLSFRADSSAEPDQAFGLWRDFIRPIFDVELAEQASFASFGTTAEAVHLGQAVIYVCQSSSQTFLRRPADIVVSGLDHIMVQLYTAGSFTGDCDGRSVAVSSGDVLFLDLARLSITRVSAFTAITLVLPRAKLAKPLQTRSPRNGAAGRGGLDPVSRRQLAGHSAPRRAAIAASGGGGRRRRRSARRGEPGDRDRGRSKPPRYAPFVVAPKTISSFI